MLTTIKEALGLVSAAARTFGSPPPLTLRHYGLRMDCCGPDAQPSGCGMASASAPAGVPSTSAQPPLTPNG